jgi:RecB family exonuclease
METYKKCPKNYHYRYIEKPEIEKIKWGFTEFGSCAHRILELFHERILKEDIPSSRYSILMKECFKAGVKEFDIRILEQHVWMPSGDMPGMLALRKVVQDYLDKIRADGLPNVIANEMGFKFHINEKTLVRGFIDRVDRVAPGEYHVVDYKTSKNKKYLKEFQLLTYAEALRRRYDDVKIVHGSFVMLKHNSETKNYTFNIDDMDRGLANIYKRADFIDTDTTWIKKPTILCRYCDYKPICQDAWAG